MAKNETPKVKKDGTVKYSDGTKVSNSVKIGNYESKGLVQIKDEHGKIVHSSLEESKRVHDGVKSFHHDHDGIARKTTNKAKALAKSSAKDGAMRYANSSIKGLKNSTKGTFEEAVGAQKTQSNSEVTYRLKRKGIDAIKTHHRNKKIKKNTTVIKDNGDGTYTINHSKAEQKKGAPKSETIKGDYTGFKRNNELSKKQKKKVDKQADKLKKKQKKKNSKKIAKDAKKSTKRKAVEKSAKAAAKAAKEGSKKALRALGAAMGPVLFILIVVGCIIMMMIFIPLIGGVAGGGAIGAIASTSYQNDEDELVEINNKYATKENNYVQSLIDLADDPYTVRQAVYFTSDGTPKETFTDGEYYEIEYDIPMTSHNPYTLLSYLTAVAENGKIDTSDENITAAANLILPLQYQDNTYLMVSTETRTVKAYFENCREEITKEDDPTTAEDETEYGACVWDGTYREGTVETQVPVLVIAINNKGLETVVNDLMNDSQKDMYATLQDTLGNFPELFGEDYSQYLTSGSNGGGINYTPSIEVLANTDFATIYNNAAPYVGTPYILGANGPNAFDCSGFVIWVLNHSGYNLPDITAQGLYETFGSVPEAERKPGDLIYLHTFEGGNYITHIGIYLGDDMMIAADSSGDGKVEAVRISPLSWWRINGHAPIGYGHVY